MVGVSMPMLRTVSVDTVAGEPVDEVDAQDSKRMDCLPHYERRALWHSFQVGLRLLAPVRRLTWLPSHLAQPAPAHPCCVRQNWPSSRRERPASQPTLGLTRRNSSFQSPSYLMQSL